MHGLEITPIITPCKPPPERLRDSQWLNSFRCSEWDLYTLLELNARERSAFRRRLLAAHHALILSMALPESEPALEKITIAGEILTELSGLALIVRPSKRVMRLEDSGRALLQQARLELPRAFGLWIDPGETFFSIRSSISQAATEWIADPLWHTASARKASSVHKLHGWHEARWIRYYGDEQLRLAIKHSKNAQYLLVGHSKREEEAIKLQAFLKESPKGRRP